MHRNSEIPAQNAGLRHPDTESASCAGGRRVRLEGPNGRRAAQPINRLGLPVKRFVVENSHGTSFRKITPKMPWFP